ncbi:Cof-type HAD-IIB family hydrolase [Rhodoligotrophos defluvii]|uniref:Cof-type HAD-IIB family hydrolase n=1 Tax=Rhodoligotrophos defluvii TaxID=2561934 RepID=UPI001EEFD67C|nr:Cof-type HAD-IIB family hydrolase [Rhodoligotrophos defluvii]
MTDATAPDFSSLAARAGGRVRLVVSDVDGSLVTREKVLTPSAVAAAKDLKAAGIAFTAVSSRPPRGMAMLIEPLAITQPLGAFNGGTIFMPDMTVIDQQAVPLEAARRAVTVMRDYGADIWVFSGDKWLVTNPDAHYIPRERRTVQFEPTVVADLDPYLGSAGKIVGSSEDFDRLKECELALQAELHGSATARRSQNYYLDVTPPGMDKGYAVRTLARMMNIPLQEVAVIGDMVNDLPMFRAAGLAIAMGNGSDEVKAAADHVTDTCDNEGFAKAVAEFILPLAGPGQDEGSAAGRSTQGSRA